MNVTGPCGCPSSSTLAGASPAIGWPAVDERRGTGLNATSSLPRTGRFDACSNMRQGDRLNCAGALSDNSGGQEGNETTQYRHGPQMRHTRDIPHSFSRRHSLAHSPVR